MKYIIFALALLPSLFQVLVCALSAVLIGGLICAIKGVNRQGNFIMLGGTFASALAAAALTPLIIGYFSFADLWVIEIAATLGLAWIGFWWGMPRRDARGFFATFGAVGCISLSTFFVIDHFHRSSLAFSTTYPDLLRQQGCDENCVKAISIQNSGQLMFEMRSQGCLIGPMTWYPQGVVALSIEAGKHYPEGCGASK